MNVVIIRISTYIIFILNKYETSCSFFIEKWNHHQLECISTHTFISFNIFRHGISFSAFTAETLNFESYSWTFVFFFSFREILIENCWHATREAKTFCFYEIENAKGHFKQKYEMIRDEIKASNSNIYQLEI